MSNKPIRTIQDFYKQGLIKDISPDIQKVAEQYFVSITPTMAELIDPDNAADPIAAQFVPTEDELIVCTQELLDPIGDKSHSPLPGIVHRYPDRLLLNLLTVCPVYCRYCFRREQVGKNGSVLTQEQQNAALDYIRVHTEIWEVILSGGDPLMMTDRRLSEVLNALHAINHVKVIRIHTRVPIVDPARITDEMIQAIKGKKPIYILIHCNHAKELTEDAKQACARLVDAGIPLLSQSVLLRGVNDSAPILEELMRTFVENRIKPHYLHHVDLARGTSHFRLPLEKAQQLLRALRGKVSGLCQPTYILDIPGGHGKVPVGPVYIKGTQGQWTVEDVGDQEHTYSESTATENSET